MTNNSYPINYLEKTYNNNIITTFEQIPKSHIGFYIIILIIFLFISKFITLTISNVFFIIVAIIIIYLIYSKQYANVLPLTKDIQTKIELITPQPTRLGPNYPDLVNFL